MCHPGGQILGSAATGCDAHKCLALGKGRPAFGSKCHVRGSDKFCATATGEPRKLDDGHLRLRSQKLAERLERVETFRRVMRKFAESLRVIDQGHVDMCDKELGIGTLEN